MITDNPVYTLLSSRPTPDGLPWLFAAKKSGLALSQDGGASWQTGRELGLPDDLPVLGLASALRGNSRRIWLGLAGGILLGLGGETSQTWAWQNARFSTPLPVVSALAISPAFAADRVLLAATVEDGVLRSADGGQNWAGWNFNLLDLNVLCLAMSPAYAQDETAFAGTGSGLFRSTNGGRSWIEITPPSGNDAVLSLALSPHFGEDRRLWVGTETQGVLASQDGGGSWEKLGQLPLADPINALVCAPDLAVLTDTQLWASPDQGEKWQEIPIELPADIGLTALAAPDGLGAGKTFWVGCSNGQVISCRM